MRTAFKAKLIFIVLMLVAGACMAQTTGKISGIVVNQENGEPLPGANILLAGTPIGASAGVDGSFYILNVPPGAYTIRVQMIGFETLVLNDARVSVNRTLEIAPRLKPTVLAGTEVVVTAEKVQLRKDQTSSVRNVSAEEIGMLPVENLGQVIEMQAGVVNGHFRGGRDTEVTYLIDGMQVSHSFSGSSGAIGLETAAVQDLEVITGTFNAEYGRAMSGVVNAVTKSGGNQFHGSASGGLANYFTRHNDVFTGLGTGDYLTRNLSRDYKLQLEGPVLKDRLTFFLNYRDQNNNGHLNGIRRFNPWDYSDYPADDPAAWHTEHTGDNRVVSMQNGLNRNFLGKLSFHPLKSLRMDALLSTEDQENRYYSHYLKYIPDYGRRNFHRARMGAFSVNHMLRPSLFYDLKVSLLRYTDENYLFENPLDGRYLHPKYAGNGLTGFATGGTIGGGTGKSTDTFTDANVKLDVYWQVNRHHSLKGGVLVTDHEIDRKRIDVRNTYAGLAEENDFVADPLTGKIDFPYYGLEIVPVTDKTMDVYTVKPREFSGYLQDKMEFNEMVINLGLRYDHFNSNQAYPTDRRNPSNQLNLPDTMMSRFEKAPPQTQLSPRFGLAYQLSDQAVMHVSYGHFFQMPPYNALYANNIFRVPVNNFGTIMGNTQLNAQKTVTYEIGIWQEIMKGMGLDVSLYYRDIYDLLSTKIVTTYNQILYGLYTNKDYGNARGLELKWTFERRNFRAGVNYTLGYTRGNADNPAATFTRAGSSMDPIKRLIRMPWDQRHTLNATAGYAAGRFGVTVTGYYNSGMPYTFTPLGISPLSEINLYANNDDQPVGYTFDLSGYWNVATIRGCRLQLTLNVYNLFDRKNAVWVYGDTGQPYTRIVFEREILSHRSDFNDLMDVIHDPTAYSAPRQVKIGFGIVF